MRPTASQPTRLTIPAWLVISASLCLASRHVEAENDWPGFRGDGSGITTSSTLPTTWSPVDGIAWKAVIGGYGQSAPVVWGGGVYLTSSDGPFQERCQVHAFDLQTGQKRWTVAVQATAAVENYFRNSRAAPTCAVDEIGVYSFFPSGDVTGISHDGKIRWSVPLLKEIGEVDNERGVASSLAQTDSHVFVVIDHHGPSCIVAIDKRDGRIAWKTDRGNRVPSWSSPVVAHHDKRDWVVISSSDTVDAYDATTGELLWQQDGIPGNHIPSASIVGNRIYVGSTTMYGGESDPEAIAGSNCCIELRTDNGKPSHKVLWGAERANSYYSSPLALGGYVYYVNKAGVLYCVNAETGRQVFAKRIDNPCWASAIGVKNPAGEDLAYFPLKNGTTIVLRPGEQYDQVARNRLWDAEEMVEAAREATELRRTNAVPVDQAKPKTGPERVFAGLPERQLHQMFSYGDPTVYGFAASGGSLLFRTGQRLYCVRIDGSGSAPAQHR